jgi:O-succinylbenzoate synthase
MKIDQIIIYKISLRLKEPFSTILGTFQERAPILVEIRSEGISGWGEASALPFPYYNHEDSSSVMHLLQNYICPLVIKEQPQSIESLNQILSQIVGNNIAKAGIELAFWDLHAKRAGVPLYKLLGGVRKEIESGVVVPDFNDQLKTLERVAEHIEQGYKKIKLKISPGRELSLVQAVCSKFSGTSFSLDANAAYSLANLDLFKELDDLNLLMIEQPFAKDEFLDHAKLQAQMKTPICLDESIENRLDAKLAIKLGSCKVINLKPTRVGGLQEVLAVHDLTKSSNIGVCCGGMLETGIGRAHSLASATLLNYAYPADLSESKRYFDEDIVEPAISFASPGVFELTDKPGIGLEVKEKTIEKLLIQKLLFKN